MYEVISTIMVWAKFSLFEYLDPVCFYDLDGLMVSTRWHSLGVCLEYPPLQLGFQRISGVVPGLLINREPQ